MKPLITIRGSLTKKKKKQFEVTLPNLHVFNLIQQYTQ